MTQTTATDKTAAAQPAVAVRTLLQRVIMPRAGDPISVRSLYLDEHADIQLSTVPALPTAPSVRLRGTSVHGRALRATSRTTAVLPAQSEVSFAAYFNAFAAGYWRHWSVLTAVRLHLQLRGTARIILRPIG